MHKPASSLCREFGIAMLSFLSELEGTKGRNLGASLKNKVYFLKHKFCENMTTEFAQEAESRIRLTNSRRRGTGLQEKNRVYPADRPGKAREFILVSKQTDSNVNSYSSIKVYKKYTSP